MTIGPPGCGKTHALCDNIEKAIELWSPGEVLVSSLTKAAAATIKHRKIAIPSSQVKTIHAHCYAMLDRPNIAETKIESWNELHPGFSMEGKAAYGSEGGGVEGTFSEHGKTLLEDYGRRRAAMTPQDRWSSRLCDFAIEWEDWKKQNGYLDFQDLIEKAIEERLPPPNRAKYVLVDECQDCSASELELLKVWSNSSNIVMTGDVDQLIFSFRGSTPEAFNSLEIPEAHQRVLEQSFRVPKAVCAYADAWIRKVKDRKEVTYKPRDAPGEVRRLGVGFHNGDLGKLLQDAKRYAGKSIMFLASCGYMLYDLIARLKEEGIPFCNPYREEELRWNPLRSISAKRLSGADRVRAFLEVNRDGARWTPKSFKTWMDMIESSGVFRNGAKAEITRIVERQPEDQPFEFMDDIEFASYFETPEIAYEAIEAGWNSDVDWLEGKMLVSKSKGAKYAMNVVRNCGSENLSKRPKIYVGTIHSVKGGEADAVYLLSAISGASKNYAQRGRGSEGIDCLRRMFYVGMTRARESLILCRGGGSAGQHNMRWI